MNDGSLKSKKIPNMSFPTGSLLMDFRGGSEILLVFQPERG